MMNKENFTKIQTKLKIDLIKCLESSIKDNANQPESKYLQKIQDLSINYEQLPGAENGTLADDQN